MYYYNIIMEVIQIVILFSQVKVQSADWSETFLISGLSKATVHVGPLVILAIDSPAKAASRFFSVWVPAYLDLGETSINSSLSPL